ncbi:hypothetical protein [Streptomyces tsukubensis]|uniref:Uncharacterized protein n=1 Tax=Streptomyces tsukubensis TaxID=83656 RepID=A0A1V4A4I8_9ACTN|nr:hypothetical protein B1H18_23510 [Streptomyces tsukubensis]
MLVLPYGYAYGRADAASVEAALDAVRAHRVVVEGCRGNSAWDRAGQAAELAVRAAADEDRAGVLSVTTAEAPVPHSPGGDGEMGGDGAEQHHRIAVTHRDGREWLVTVAMGAALPPRPESCGATLGSPARMDVLDVHRQRTAVASA